MKGDPPQKYRANLRQTEIYQGLSMTTHCTALTKRNLHCHSNLFETRWLRFVIMRPYIRSMTKISGTAEQHTVHASHNLLYDYCNAIVDNKIKTMLA